MRNCRVTLICVLACVVFTALAQAIDVPLTYERYADNEERFRPYGGHYPPDLKLSKLSGMAKLPELQGDTPLFCSIELADTEYFVVFACQKAGDPFYNVLYFDQNANGDLTDDPVVKGSAEKPYDEYYQATFPAMDLELKVGDTTVPYSIRPEVRTWNHSQFKKGGLDENSMRGILQAGFRLNCAYYGRLEAAGNTCNLALGDANGNGLFSDVITVDKNVQYMMPSAMYARGDNIYLSGGDMSYRDRMMLGKQLWFSGQLYDFAVDIPAKMLHLTPVTDDLGTVEFAMEPETAVLNTEDNAQSVMLYRPGKSAQAPPGKFRVFSYRLEHKDKKDCVWLLQAGATPNSPLAEVKSGNSTKLVFGEPFVPVADVPKYSMDQFNQGASEVQVYFGVEGVGKEMVTDLRLVSGENPAIAVSSEDPSRPKEPSYKVVTEDGETVTAGAFRYG